VSDADTGSRLEFDASWKTRSETRYNHWTAGWPRNQIQLAFRSHWQLFRDLIGDRPPGRCLEIGCGRGSVSSYFADVGWDTVLLDYSEEVLHVARDIFWTNGHRASYVTGDARALPVEDGAVDVVVSIGLLEHFEDIRPVLDEQVRVLAPGGTLLVYVVPERPDNLQRWFRWVNALLGGAARLVRWERNVRPKPELYRSDEGSARYLEVLAGAPLEDVRAFGVYPLPMVSHSPEFPFSLLPAPMERTLAGLFRAALAVRRVLFRRNPWICSEELGQAFLVVGRKAGP
jgi:SAM-dependent methyltransferase